LWHSASLVAASSSSHLLLVDDDEGTLETFGFALRASQFRVSVACTVAEATRLARSLLPTLLLCDLNLPDGTGLDVLRQLRQMQISTPFVIMTGFGTIPSAVEACRLGASDYLEKPIDLDRLLAVVRTHAAPASNVGLVPPVASQFHVARIRQVIESRYADAALGPRDVAQAVGISIQHMQRVMKRHFGVTVVELLRAVRLREARVLLADPSCSVKEIAYQVGFRHPSQFTRAFREQCGVSPSQYRYAAGDDVRQ